jgi:hypothetical protein
MQLIHKNIIRTKVIITRQIALHFAMYLTSTFMLEKQTGSFKTIIVCFSSYTFTNNVTFSWVSWSYRGCSVCLGNEGNNYEKAHEVVSLPLLGRHVGTECLQGEGACSFLVGDVRKGGCDTTEHSPPSPFYIIAMIKINKTMCWSGWQLALATMTHNHKAYISVILTVDRQAQQFMTYLACIDIDLCWRNENVNRCLYRQSNATVLGNPLKNDFLL